MLPFVGTWRNHMSPAFPVHSLAKATFEKPKRMRLNFRLAHVLQGLCIQPVKTYMYVPLPLCCPLFLTSRSGKLVRI